MTTLFTSDHEWLRIEGDVATIGITDYAQQQLGDVVYVELPDVGKALERGKEVAQSAAQSAADTVSEEGRKHGEQLADSAKENAASVRQ